MCVTMNGSQPADLAKTITGTVEVVDPKGDVVQAIFYQNQINGSPMATPGPSRGGRLPQGLAHLRATPTAYDAQEARGDALVIPILTDDFGSITPFLPPANFLDTIAAHFPGEVSFSMSFSRGISKGAVVHLQLGGYHVVCAEYASDIAGAVREVEPSKRPRLTQDVCDELERGYRSPFGVCCFAPGRSLKTEPIAFGYKPRKPGVLRMYMLEAHGTMPNYDEVVDADHTVFFGSYQSTYGAEMYYGREPMDPKYAHFAPARLGGIKLTETKKLNGDLVLYVNDLQATGQAHLHCETPPEIIASPTRPVEIYTAYTDGAYDVEHREQTGATSFAID